MKHKNLYIYQNSTYDKLLSIKNDDGTSFVLTGYTVSVVISKHFESMPKYQFPVTITNAATGTVKFELDENDTSTLPSGSLVYSMWATHSTNGRTILLQGTAFVEATVFEGAA